MKMQIKEFAELTGVSVRTLHYYDEIGLLKPSEVDAQNGYRFYDEKSLERMREILFYRELDFSLKTIAEILSSPGYDKQQALSRQRKLLLSKKERLEQLIAAIDSVEKGEGFMTTNNDYEALKNQYAEEVKQRWGNTEISASQRLCLTRCLKSLPNSTAAVFRQTMNPQKFRLKNYSGVSLTTSTPAQTKSLQVSVRCM